MITTGSSYIKRQSPGSERFGGLTITTTRGDGQRTVLKTNWFDDSHITDEIDSLIAAAWKGVDRYIAGHGIDASLLNISLSKFAYHPIDSRGSTFEKAAYHAFAAAVQYWPV